jgi:O-antigen/teichoic acid export membrane protein
VKINLKGEFTNNFLKLSFGNLVAQILPILISPILTRIYSVEELGGIGLFTSLVLFFGSISALRYEQAIVITTDKKEKELISLSSILIVIIVSILYCIIALAVDTQIDGIPFSLALGTLPILFIGVSNIGHYINIKEKNFGNSARANVIKSSSNSLLQLGLGVAKIGLIGLIISNIISTATFAAVMLRHKKFPAISFLKVKQILIKYKEFPMFSFPGTLLSNFTNYALIFTIGFIYNSQIVGYYYLVSRILGIPSNFIGSAISNVIYERFSTLKSEKYIFKLFYKKVFILLILGSVVVFSLMMLFSVYLIVPIFGKDWMASSEIGIILIPLFFVRFIGSGISTIINIYSYQKWNLVFNGALVLVFGLSVSTAWYLKMNPFEFFKLYSAVMIVMYILFIIFCSRIVYLKNNEG